jgi:putative FmdB family regulatory protein
MPAYDYKCEACGESEEKTHLMSENPEYKCSNCGKVLVRQFSVNTSGFIMKGGTPTTHWKEKRLRMKKREEIGTRPTHYKDPKVTPNIAGVETGTWSDAQKMAKEAGLNHESYTPFVEKEKKSPNNLIIS